MVRGAELEACIVDCYRSLIGEVEGGKIQADSQACNCNMPVLVRTMIEDNKIELNDGIGKAG